ncbi:Lsr2 family protein [Dactylosporangium sp. NPDC051484]|uniref:histone-like nucleoid-structuring protein Lsr2 n=1 Tax=Dactylosporangium sp. NPDC051484 TaxID=3154942 RepID=UPI00344D79E5
MAKRVIHELIDDIDGKPAAESIVFALDGVQYEIDLSAANAVKLRDAVAPFVAAATKIGRGGVVATSRGREVRGRSVTRGDRDQNRAIREWAQAKGIDVSDRGRIKQDIVDRYHAEAGR